MKELHELQKILEAVSTALSRMADNESKFNLDIQESLAYLARDIGITGQSLKFINENL